jgi:hypothetical protein
VAVGLENSDVFVEAFRGAASLAEAAGRYAETLEAALVPLDARVRRLVEQAGVVYGGIDASLNPTTEPDKSLVLGYEAVLGEGNFGRSGTLVRSSQCRYHHRRDALTPCCYVCLAMVGAHRLFRRRSRALSRACRSS